MIAQLGLTVVLSLGGCPIQDNTSAQTRSGLTGDAAAGQTKFEQTCARCHSAVSLAPRAASIRTNLGSISYSMAGITLTDQEVVDLQAYLATK